MGDDMNSDQARANVLCLKWGDRYSPHYVNALYKSVQRHLRRPFEFHCCTDDGEGLEPGVRVIPFPENPGIKRGWPDILVKLALLQDGFGGLQGPTLFLDLDVVITGDIDCFFDYKPGEFCIIHNWVNWRKAMLGRRPAVGNSSVFRFDAGRSNVVYETFLREMAQAEDRNCFNTEQAFLTHAMGKVNWWPEEWVRSYKWNCRPAFPLNYFVTPTLPPGCRILVFHGRPDPDEAIQGYRGKKVHHYLRPAPWIAEYWR
ncbi:MAG: hypothetical protein ABR544_02080 [Gammaproteobacteria bacterium]